MPNLDLMNLMCMAVLVVATFRAWRIMTAAKNSSLSLPTVYMRGTAAGQGEGGVEG